MIDLRVSLCGFTSFDGYRKARARRTICTILASVSPIPSSVCAPDRLVTVLRRRVMDVREMFEDGDEGEFRAIFLCFSTADEVKENIAMTRGFTALDTQPRTGLTVDMPVSIRSGSPMRQAKNNANLVQISSVIAIPHYMITYSHPPDADHVAGGPISCVLDLGRWSAFTRLVASDCIADHCIVLQTISTIGSQAQTLSTR